jgi:hypothetical protein
MKKTMSVLLMGFMAWLELSGGFESKTTEDFSIRPLFAEFADRVGTHLDHFSSTLRGMWRMCGCTFRTPDLDP